MEFRSLHKYLIFSDISILISFRLKKNNSFFREMIIKEKYSFVFLASDLILLQLKNFLTQVFFYGFHKVQSPFYQLLTIYVFDDKNSFYTPIMHVLIDPKEEAGYDFLFNELTKILLRPEL